MNGQCVLLQLLVMSASLWLLNAQALAGALPAGIKVYLFVLFTLSSGSAVWPTQPSWLTDSVRKQKKRGFVRVG